MPPKIINASQAHKLLIRQGYEMSYPTAIKWLKDNGLAKQDMPYGTISVDLDLLTRFLRDMKSSKLKPAPAEARRPPGRKKSDA